MNKTQIQTTAAPMIAFFAGLLAGKGVFGLDAATWTQIIGGIAGLAATIWGIVAARPIALKDTTGSLPMTTVITDGASAAALPNNPDVVAATPQIVAAVNASK